MTAKRLSWDWVLRTDFEIRVGISQTSCFAKPDGFDPSFLGCPPTELLLPAVEDGTFRPKERLALPGALSI